MTHIFVYQKYIDAVRTVEFRFPEDENHQRIGNELATLGDDTYVSIPEDQEIPSQPAEISAREVVLTPELKQQISDASPLVRLIRCKVSEKISAKYSIGDEIKLIRTAPSAEFDAYNAYAEDCRAWGREQKALLGL